jgi:hypothetical protein
MSWGKAVRRRRDELEVCSPAQFERTTEAALGCDEAATEDSKPSPV